MQLLHYKSQDQSTKKIANAESLAAHYITEHRSNWEPSTVNRKLAAFRAYASFLGLTNFLSTYRAPTAAKAQPHPLPGGLNDIVAMIEATNKEQYKCLIVLCGLVGCRVSEALKVRPSHIDLEYMQIKIYGKGDKHRIVPMAASVFQYLIFRIAATTPTNDRLVNLEDRAARRAVTRVGRKALGRDVASHDLRMTFGTCAYAKCGDLRVVQELMGHASSSTTEGYTGVSESDMRDAVDLLKEDSDD